MIRTPPCRLLAALPIMLALAGCPTAREPRPRPAPSTATTAPAAVAPPTTTGPRLLELDGAMPTGTRWHVRLVLEDAAAAARAATLAPMVTAIHTEVLRQLDGRNRESELGVVSRTPARRPLPVSRSTLDVLGTALDVARRTDGAFDPTAGPVRAVWGLDTFAGAAVSLSGPPAGELVTQARARVGHARVREVKGLLQKDVVDLELDLSTVSDAATAAAIARALGERAFDRFVVEIGEVVVTAGAGLEGPWTVSLPGGTAIATPADGAKIVVAQRRAPATTLSVGGAATRPIIDPRTARPVTHDVDGCTVLAPITAAGVDVDVVAASALAEACLVLGEDGLKKILARFPGVEVAWTHRTATTETTSTTAAFPARR